MKNKKPIIFLVMLFVVTITVAGTIAYYTSSDTFDNTFNSGTYDVETQENFVSPDNWTPGTTTPKTVIATNKGTTPAAVRVKLTPSWVDKDGNPLSLTDSNDNNVAIINFSNDYTKKWVYQDGYYYYKRALNENQSTTSLLKSITFNPNAEIDKTKNCETVNGITTCRTTYNDYSGGTYTLQVEVETCQYDQYQEIWGVTINLQDPILVDGTLMVHDNYSSKTFGKSIARSSFESITTVDNINIPEEAIDSWDVSATRNGTVIAWYLDADNDEKYELYIGQEDGVKANPNSSYVFSNFSNVTSIDLTNYDIAGVTNMSYMFFYLGSNDTTFNLLDLSDWDTSNVTNMVGMVAYAGMNATTWSIGDISNWDVSNVTNMSSMFSYSGYNSTNWNVGNLNKWNTSKVTDMSAMFSHAGYKVTTFNLNINSWDTSKVTNMSYMFDYAGISSTTFNLDLSSWDTSSVTNMNYMFEYTGAGASTFDIGDISNWNTSNVTTMLYMFYNTGFNATTWNIGNLSNWNTSNVTTMRQMFSYAGHETSTFNLDLSSWNTGKVTDMYMMFYEAGRKATVWSIGILSNWNVSNVETMQSVFQYAGYSATTFNIGNLSSWDTSKVTNMSSMFDNAGYSATTWNSIGTLKVYATSINSIFRDCKNAKVTLNIYGNPTSYNKAFYEAATISGSNITVNYSSTTTNIDDIIATKSSNSNVVKGSQLD